MADTFVLTDHVVDPQLAAAIAEETAYCAASLEAVGQMNKTLNNTVMNAAISNNLTEAASYIEVIQQTMDGLGAIATACAAISLDTSTGQYHQTEVETHGHALLAAMVGWREKVISVFQSQSSLLELSLGNSGVPQITPAAVQEQLDQLARAVVELRDLGPEFPEHLRSTSTAGAANPLVPEPTA